MPNTCGDCAPHTNKCAGTRFPAQTYAGTMIPTHTQLWGLSFSHTQFGGIAQHTPLSVGAVVPAHTHAGGQVHMDLPEVVLAPEHHHARGLVPHNPPGLAVVCVPHHSLLGLWPPHHCLQPNVGTGTPKHVDWAQYWWVAGAHGLLSPSIYSLGLSPV